MRRLLLACAIVLGLAGVVWAFPWETPLTDSVNVVESMRVMYDQTDPDNPFWATVNRLNLLVAKGRFLASLRYDTEAYFLEEEYYARYVPEKFFFQYEQKPFLVRVGDSFVRFGQGLTLSLLQRDEFGEDTTIQGLLFHEASDYFDFDAIGGPVNVGDGRSFTPVRAQTEEPEFFDERDLLYGGQFMAGHPRYLKVGMSYVGGTVRYDPESTLARFEEDDNISLYSIIADSPDLGGVGAAQGEYAWLEREDLRNEIEDVAYEGRGAHVATTWYIGPVTALMEGTDYFRFDYEYNDPPSMDYPKVSFGHLPNYQDAIGGRARLDYVITAINLGLYANYLNIQTHEEMPLDLAGHYGSDDSPWLEWIEHAYGGFDRAFGNGAMLTGAGGYREIVEGRWVHGELDFNTPIVRPHSLAAGYHVKQFHGFGTMQETDYSAHEATLTYGWAPYLSLTGTYEYSNEPVGGEISLGGEEEDEDPNYWAVESMVRPVDWLQMVFAYGRYKGGLKCSGGVCRMMPPFEGFKSEFVVRF